MNPTGRETGEMPQRVFIWNKMKIYRTGVCFWVLVVSFKGESVRLSPFSICRTPSSIFFLNGALRWFHHPNLASPLSYFAGLSALSSRKTLAKKLVVAFAFGDYLHACARTSGVWSENIINKIGHIMCAVFLLCLSYSHQGTKGIHWIFLAWVAILPLYKIKIGPRRPKRSNSTRASITTYSFNG